MPENATLDRPAAATADNAAETQDPKAVVARYAQEALADIQSQGGDEEDEKPARARRTEARQPKVQRETPAESDEDEEEEPADLLAAADADEEEAEEEVDEFERLARAREAKAEARGREAATREKQEEDETASQRQSRLAEENRVRTAYASRIASFDLDESAANLVGLTLEDARAYLREVKGMFNAHHQDITGHASQWETPRIANQMLDDIYGSITQKAGLSKKLASALVAKRGEIKDSPTFIREVVSAAREGFVPAADVETRISEALVAQRQEKEASGEWKPRGSGAKGRNGGASVAGLSFVKLQDLYGSGDASPAQEAEFLRLKRARDAQKR